MPARERIDAADLGPKFPVEMRYRTSSPATAREEQVEPDAAAAFAQHKGFP